MLRVEHSIEHSTEHSIEHSIEHGIGHSIEHSGLYQAAVDRRPHHACGLRLPPPSPGTTPAPSVSPNIAEPAPKPPPSALPRGALYRMRRPVAGTFYGMRR